MQINYAMKRNQFLPALEKSNHLHMPTYYYCKTGYIPSVLTYFRIDVQQLYDKLVSTYKLTNKQIVKTQSVNTAINRLKISTAYIELPCSIFLYLGSHHTCAELYYNNTTSQAEIDKIQSLILDCLKKVHEEKKVGLIVSDSGGSFEIREFNIINQHDDIANLYNDDFKSFNDELITKLQRSNSNGIVLLHGQPGTGKSSYIRHLIGAVKKNFIYLPSSMANHIAHPSFLQFLSKHSNSILIIEDAEELLMKRKSDSKPAISNLLNLSDGLLADCLRVQVITTFNCEYNKIDEAFLRKGRVLGRYCFQRLTTEKSNNLLRRMEFNFKTSCPMSLAEIFNYKDEDYSMASIRSPLGFTNQTGA